MFSNTHYFYRTCAGLEIDLVLLPQGKPPVAVEIKFTSTPKISKGFRIAFDELGCSNGFIVCQTKERYPVSKNIEVIPVQHLELFKEHGALKSSAY